MSRVSASPSVTSVSLTSLCVSSLRSFSPRPPRRALKLSTTSPQRRAKPCSLLRLREELHTGPARYLNHCRPPVPLQAANSFHQNLATHKVQRLYDHSHGCSGVFGSSKGYREGEGDADETPPRQCTSLRGHSHGCRAEGCGNVQPPRLCPRALSPPSRPPRESQTPSEPCPSNPCHRPTYEAGPVIHLTCVGPCSSCEHALFGEPPLVAQPSLGGQAARHAQRGTGWGGGTSRACRPIPRACASG